MSSGGVGALRWFAKKAARLGVALGSRATAFARRGAACRVRALTYHRFGTTPRDPFSVTLGDFDEQMGWLAGKGLAVSLEQVEAFCAGRGSVPDGAALVTIDDGDPSVHDGALAILERHRIPAVVFAIAGEVDRATAGQSAESMTRQQLERLVEGGVTIGSHAWSHRSMGRLSADEVADEARRSREALEDWLGRPVRSFAYPFGTLSDFSTETARILGEAGYTCAFTSQHGAMEPGADMLTLPRIKVEGGEGSWFFRGLVRGSLDPWALVDRTLWRLQAADRG